MNETLRAAVAKAMYANVHNLPHEQVVRCPYCLEAADRFLKSPAGDRIAAVLDAADEVRLQRGRSNQPGIGVTSAFALDRLGFALRHLEEAAR